MRKSTLKLPSLRPATPMTLKKERNVFQLTGANARPNTDYEVNRTIFLDMKPKDPDELKRKKKSNPKTLDPLSIDTTQDSKEPKIKKVTKKSKNPKNKTSSLSTAKPNSKLNSNSTNNETSNSAQKPTNSNSNFESTDEENFSEISEIQQIEDLMCRIPTADTEVSPDTIYKITPVLDRVLYIVGSFQCIEYINHPVICELFKRLFALIDVDDFLSRIIICRILLMFVSDEKSSLILPISKIFYKLSCDPSNDDYFVDENLEMVLISILRMKNIDASLMAAGTIRNLAAFEPMREKLCEKDDLFDFIFDTFNDKESLFNQNQEMKIQLLGIVRRMSKSTNFKNKVLESNFLSMAFSDKQVTSDVLKTLCKIGELTDEGKHDFIEWFIEFDISDVNLIIQCLPIVCNKMEDKSICGKLIMKLLNIVGKDQEKLSKVLPIMTCCCENKESLDLCIDNSSFFTDLVKSTEIDTNIRIEAYKIVKRFPKESFNVIQKDFLFLDSLVKRTL